MSEEESEDGEEAKMVQSDQNVATFLVPLDPGGVGIVPEELDELPDEWLREEPKVLSTRESEASDDDPFPNTYRHIVRRTHAGVSVYRSAEIGFPVFFLRGVEEGIKLPRFRLAGRRRRRRSANGSLIVLHLHLPLQSERYVCPVLGRIQADAKTFVRDRFEVRRDAGGRFRVTRFQTEADFGVSQESIRRWREQTCSRRPQTVGTEIAVVVVIVEICSPSLGRARRSSQPHARRREQLERIAQFREWEWR